MHIFEFNSNLPSAGKQCCVKGEVKSKVPHAAGGEGWPETNMVRNPSTAMAMCLAYILIAVLEYVSSGI
jgi:hypothetical protein